MTRSLVRHHHFVAVLPDAATAERIREMGEALRARHRLRAVLRPSQVFHVSLHALPDDPEILSETLQTANRACEAMAAATPPFEVILNQVLSYGGRFGRRSLVLADEKSRNAGLLRLHQTLGKELRRAGFPVSLSFSPHLTLLYGDHDVKEPIEPVKWNVDEFVLVRSHVGFTRYDFLERWKLRGDKNTLPMNSVIKPRSSMVQTEFPLD